jgi:tetratricopeptide (TPR) repeat protein
MPSIVSQLRRAAAHFQRGDFELARSSCRKLVEQDPKLFDAHHLLGLSLLQMGHFEPAISALRLADQIRPGELQLQSNLVVALVSSGRTEQASDLLEQLLKTHPTNQNLLFQQASLLSQIGQQERAEQVLEQLLELNPAHLSANGMLAQLLEQRQQDERALRHAETALGLDAGHFVAGFSRARVLARQSRTEEAHQEFTRLLRQSESPVNRSLSLTALGKLEDKEGNYDQAFSNFLAANQQLSQSTSAQQVRDNSVYSLEAQRELRDYFTSERLMSWPDLAGSTAEAGRAPVFLVGFPRSGTTLMDRVLDAHPDVAVVEEQPTLHMALSELVQDEASLKRMSSLGKAEAAGFRRDYWERLSGHVKGGLESAAVIVDKLPLNLIFVGLIYRLFPQARFIVAIRDPRDVCLSCFMQSFGMNDAMSHFLQLESTVDYYRSAMQLGLSQLDALPAAQHHCRYEDLIEQPETQARDLLAFLELPWDSRVLSFHEKARGQRIDTPSYEQVTRPLYRSSIGRWRNYRKQLQPIEEPLRPFLQRFGYPSE